jgi:hypothetical protein
MWWMDKGPVSGPVPNRRTFTPFQHKRTLKFKIKMYIQVLTADYIKDISSDSWKNPIYTR